MIIIILSDKLIICLHKNENNAVTKDVWHFIIDIWLLHNYLLIT